MAGRPKKPIAVLKAEGKSHMSKKQIEEREQGELSVPYTDIKPPDYLTGKKRIEEFNRYAELLLKLGIFTELDVDVLAKYILSKNLYLIYTKQLEKVMAKASVVHKWSVIDKLASICDTDGTAEELKELLEKIVRRQRGDDATVLMNLQDKAFKQCLACAKELGLTITSRCKIVVPPPPDGDDDEL